MARLATLALLLGLAAPAALAQDVTVAGLWEVERFADPHAPEAEGVGALLPEGPSLAPVALQLGPSGGATVTLLAARADGYELVRVPSTYRVDGDHVTFALGDVETTWGVERRGDRLVLTAEDGSALTLRPARDA